MVNFFEKGIRGGISQINHRHFRTNIPGSSNHCPRNPDGYALYTDANGLYAHAMTHALPSGGFEWLTEDEIRTLNIWAIPKDGHMGVVLEVDLEYPAELHDAHNDFPFCPIKRKILSTELSPLARFIAEKSKHSYPSNAEKLMTTLEPKQHYVIHYRMLQTALKHGLKLKRIWRGVRFQQSPWLREFILLLNRKKQRAETVFDRSFLKLFSNSIYGKTLESVRQRKTFKLVTDPEKFVKLASSPLFKTFTAFNKQLVGVELNPQTVFLDKPIYLGMSILDLSKSHMYKFFYNVLQKQYSGEVRMLACDTDGFIVSFTGGEHPQSFMARQAKYFDRSNFSQTNRFYSSQNAGCLGVFKDEFCALPVQEFVGLKAKMYSIIFQDPLVSGRKAAKGVPRSAMNRILHEDYLACILNLKEHYHVARRIASKKHQIFTREEHRLALSAYYDKRYLLPDGITTLAYGHHRIPSNVP